MVRLSERMGVSLRTLLRDYSRREINLRLAWMARVPSEGERIELAVAKLTELTYNMNVPKKDQKSFKDFMFIPDWGDQKPTSRKTLAELTPEEEEAMINKAFGF